jgi:hypothetical protein
MAELDLLVGKSEEEAVISLTEQKKKFRIKRKGQEEMALTMDYDEERLNLEIEAGTVVAVSIG